MASPVLWSRSIAWRFFLRTALLILLVLGAVLGVAVRQARQEAQRSASSGLEAAASLLGRTFDERAKLMDSGLKVFATYSANLADIQRLLEQQAGKGNADMAAIAEQVAVARSTVRDNLRENLAQFTADVAVVVQPDGMLLTCTTDGSKQDYRDVGIVQRAMYPEEAAAAGDQGPSYRGFFEIPSGAFKGVYHAVARRLTTAGGEFLGVMLVGTKLDTDQATALRRLALPRSEPPAHLALLSHFKLLGDTMGNPALQSQVSRALAGPAFAEARAMLGQGQVSKPVVVPLDGQDYMISLVPLRGANGADLEAAELLLMPLEPFLAPFHKIQLYILVAGAAGLLLALLMALGTARSVTAPLGRLTKATAALADGERPELPPVGRRDEVGVLTENFRILLSELKAKEELLAALDQVRAAGAVNTRVARDASMTVADVEATLNIGTRAMGGAEPAPATKRVTLKEGELFADRYMIQGVLGKGGMGVVLKAHDQQLDEEVAIKVIRPEHAVDGAFLEQLKQEIKLARRISHKYVLRTHDFGEAGGVPFVSMEYLKGVTLKQLADDRGHLPLALVLRIGRQVAEGLEAAHAVGVVHRDIKPLNVLFDARGDVKLMDFGLAAPASAAGQDKSGQVFGSPRYMAPEQVRGERVDPRTDLYAFGVMLFELSTGHAPFEHSNVTQLLRMHISEPAPRAKDVAPELPEGFSFLLERLMSKNKEDRPGSAAEVVELLKLLASGGNAETRRNLAS